MNDRRQDDARTELLLLRCRRGDTTALTQLVEAWEARLLFYIRRIIDNEEDACDVLQKTWIRALPRLGSIREPSRFVPWLYRVARSVAMNHVREDGARFRFIEKDVPVEELAGKEEPFMPGEAAAVHGALDKLEFRQREVLTLFFLRDLTLEEISELVGAPLGTVKSRLHYAKRALRAAMKEEDASP